MTQNFKRYTRHLQGIVKREQRIKKYVDGVVKRNSHKSSILVGPPGLGKSYIVLKSLAEAGRESERDYYTINGHITPAKLFAMLYLFRAKGQILVLDDCDNIFANEIGINILKAATDTTQNTVSYVSNHQIKIKGIVSQLPISIPADNPMTIKIGPRKNRNCIN
jgi:DNA replication protein DnaC